MCFLFLLLTSGGRDCPLGTTSTAGGSCGTGGGEAPDGAADGSAVAAWRPSWDWRRAGRTCPSQGWNWVRAMSVACSRWRASRLMNRLLLENERVSMLMNRSTVFLRMLLLISAERGNEMFIVNDPQVSPYNVFLVE